MQTVELVRLLNSVQNRSVFGNKGKVNPTRHEGTQGSGGVAVLTFVLNRGAWIVP